MELDIFLNNALIFFAVIMTILTVVFVVAMALRDNSIMDIAYGATFALAGTALLFINERSDTLAILIVGCVVLWALRLSIRIGRKNIGTGEDERYAAWRADWEARSTTYFVLRSYLQIYLLQGFIIAVVGLPLVLAISFAHELDEVWLAVGLAIAVFGLLYETTADWQLDRFIARKKAGTETADLMTTGLFHYSRRPNYFGEALVWWGLAFAVLPVSLGYYALLSPIVITYIVTRVTGPMLERIFLERYPAQYTHYMETTSYLVPWPPKTIPDKGTE